MHRPWATMSLTAALVLATACSSGPHTGPNTAEVLPTPFPVTLSHFGNSWLKFDDCDVDGCKKAKVHCGAPVPDTGCMTGFTVRIKNPTDRDANANDCDAVLIVGGSEQHERFSILEGGVSGLWLPAGSTETAHGVLATPISSAELRRLPPTLHGTCAGWDWHGYPPV